MTNNIKVIRERLGLSRVEFAKRIGMAYSTICNYEYENKSPRVQTCYRIIKLAKEFNINISMEDIRPPLD